MRKTAVSGTAITTVNAHTHTSQRSATSPSASWSCVRARERAASLPRSANGSITPPSAIAGSSSGAPTAEDDEEQAIAQYDFKGRSDGELTITENEILRILARQDMDGNAERFKVQNKFGKCGYVPSSYLSTAS